MQEKHKRKHMKEWNFGIYEVVNNFLTAPAPPPPPPKIENIIIKYKKTYRQYSYF